MPTDTLVGTVGNKAATGSQELRTTEVPAWNGKVTVLINELTTGSPELLAACLHDNGARLLGTTSAGQVSSVRLSALSDGSAMEMPAERWYDASGNLLDGVGSPRTASCRLFAAANLRRPDRCCRARPKRFSVSACPQASSRNLKGCVRTTSPAACEPSRRPPATSLPLRVSVPSCHVGGVQGLCFQCHQVDRVSPVDRSEGEQLQQDEVLDSGHAEAERAHVQFATTVQHAGVKLGVPHLDIHRQGEVAPSTGSQKRYRVTPSSG